MTDFDLEFQKLNAQQRQAVEAIDGPVLVVAGPGTGKTQLLSARVANILQKTDTLPQSILCLTFTESGARAMRERLTGMIGADAYDVQISTYHSFGSEIIARYPEFFETIAMDRNEDIRFEQPIDELGQLQLIVPIVDTLLYDNPISGARYYPKDVIKTISELKRALISPYDLRKKAAENLQAVAVISPVIDERYGPVKRMPKIDKAAKIFEKILETLEDAPYELAEKASNSLRTALQDATSTAKTNPLTTWKNDWLHKNEDDEWEFTNPIVHQKLTALADVYQSYEKELRNSGKYDFDDMIVSVIAALKNKPELRANLQEQYQYLLLDEFQDTNPAQFELVHLIADHPVHEGKPNIMAVGDDDQAIFAFQGADVSNMIKLKESFEEVTVVNLTKNYRSHHDILHIAHNIAGQIESRLHSHLDNVEKTLEAVGDNLPETAEIERHEFTAQASEYDWIATQIDKQVKQGIPPEEIAVLAPKHSLLEALVPFLQKRDIPVSYEKRENILETPIIQSLVLQCQLVQALKNQDDHRASELFPQVLSLSFWQIPTEVIWKINWAYNKSAFNEKAPWAELAIANESLHEPVLFYLKLGSAAITMPLEFLLDTLIGSRDIEIEPEKSISSPLKSSYFSKDKQASNTVAYYEAISHLSVIRTKLRDHQQNSESLLSVDDFLAFYEAHQAAEQPIINSHPIAQSLSAVQLMTSYKAKGLEFASVFLPSLHDDVWGKKARGGSNNIPLAANLEAIRYRGSDEDELRRLLFVAVTRAKYHLQLTSHARKDSGKMTEPVKYLNETKNAETDSRVSSVLPKSHSEVTVHDHEVERLAVDIETLWQQRHIELQASLRSLLKERLDSYQMSPTHLNAFTDLVYGGPQSFLLGTILRFPQAPSEEGEFGNAAHLTLEKLQQHIKSGEPVSTFKTDEIFKKELSKRYISKDRQQYYLEKGNNCLSGYINNREDMLSRPAETEVDFRKEGVLIGKAHLSGKIDRLEVNKKDKTVAIVDFKTGKPHSKWSSNLSLHKYKQQLYFYKFLIEGSHSYQGYTVDSARLEFVEPQANGSVSPPLELDFNSEEELRLKKLIEVVWQKIIKLELPDITEYKDSIAGIKQFESDLIKD